MSQRKYTLPRHTNLAKQGARTGAFLVDVAIFLVASIAFFFGCFRLVLDPLAMPYLNEYETEEVNSHLKYRDENGDVKIIKGDQPYDVYKDMLSYYYLNYLTGDVEVPGTGSRTSEELIKDETGNIMKKSDYYTVKWFNSNILGIKTEHPENETKCLFTYKTVDGHYDFEQIGIPKDQSIVTSEQVSSYMQNAFMDAYLNSLTNLSYMVDLSNKMNFIYSLEFVLSGFIGGIIAYIVLPIVLKKGQTVGKKVFGLALANTDGYSMDNKQLLMRFMPTVVVLASFLIPIWNNMLLLLVIPLIIFLVSFALAMASPKKAALHDFCARTIVIDNRTSIIFDNELDEEKYIKKEDGLEEDEGKENEGEEPDISFER